MKLSEIFSASPKLAANSDRYDKLSDEVDQGINLQSNQEDALAEEDTPILRRSNRVRM